MDVIACLLVCVHDRACVSSRCLTVCSLVERVYLHRARALELGWLEDDLGRDTSSRVSRIVSDN